MNILFFILILLANILNPTSVLAGNDLTVNCQAVDEEGDCFVTPADTPLFAETNWLPGNYIDQALIVENESPNDACSLHFSADINTDSILKNVLENTISRDVSTVYQDTMADLLDAPDPVFIETIPSKQTYIYNWHVDMDLLANND